jgi:hypothetical protein
VRAGEKTCAAEMQQLRRRRRGLRGRVPREVLPMSEVIPFPPKPPPKSIAEETEEFLKLLERIRSSSQAIQRQQFRDREK